MTQAFLAHGVRSYVVSLATPTITFVVSRIGWLQLLRRAGIAV
jgi:hypothetical protein